MTDKLPYNDVFYPLLNAIHKAIYYVHTNFLEGNLVNEEDATLSQIFSEAMDLQSYRSTGLDNHLTRGLTLGEQKRKSRNFYPRLSRLLIHNYHLAQESKGSDSYHGLIIPSPINILYYALTVPEEPQTASYAFVTCRAMLFNLLGLHPQKKNLAEISPDLKPFSEEDILNSIISFKNYNNIQLRWPDNRTPFDSFASKLKYLCGHILSIKGYSYLWFKTAEDLKAFLTKDILVEGNVEILYGNKFSYDKRYYFRISGNFIDLPDVSEINNWIFGVPIPWRGADLVFYGGLKSSSTGGIVMSLYGAPGTGKTSTALSLAAVLSPFGTNTIYLTLEENQEDLKIRLNSLIPIYLRRLSIYSENILVENQKMKQWFTPIKLSSRSSINKINDILIALKERVDETFHFKINEEKGKNLFPSICPILVVIDNINELFDQRINYGEAEEFINYCRDLGAFVLIIAGDEVQDKNKLDYLVDVAIHLQQNGINRNDEKPVRILQLLKTRHQISRQGSHVFHLSGSNGFRISPQVPSQMDKRERIKIKLPSKNNFIHTINLLSKDEKLYIKRILQISQNSQILIHGQGSSGKAGFGMKILLTPISKKNLFLSERNNFSTDLFHKPLSKCKVLIISFLYPTEYYDELKKRIDKQFETNFENFDFARSIIKVKAFYPGFLTPEDFINKIILLLEEARLEGEPFTGVLLDGLHNVFLQFRNLQESHLIWPLLYSILYRYSVTVVSTFTNFSLEEIRNSDSQNVMNIPQDFLLMQQGQKPFLHGLVKAADYFFVLDEKPVEGVSNLKEYVLKIRSSIRQIPPSVLLRWDREKLTLHEKGQ